MVTVKAERNVDLVPRMIPRLASGDDGEVVAKAWAIVRVLKRAGSFWHDVADTWRRGEKLAERDHDFFMNMYFWYESGHLPSRKQ